MSPKFFRFFFYLGFFFTFFCSNVSAEFLSVKTKDSILFDGPSSSTKKKFIVTEGYPLKIIVSLKDWKKVEDHLGKISWIKTKDLNRERTVITLKSQAIINTDSNAYARYMARKAKQSKKDDEIRSVIRDVNELKNEMREIKNLLVEMKNGR